MKKPIQISGLRPTKQRGTNPKEEFGFVKVPLSLVPSSAAVFMAMGMKDGMKYGAFNWRKIPMQGRTLLEACQRHLNALLDGEDFDFKTGVPHGAFVMATVAIYMDCWAMGTLIDDRALPGPAGDLISLFNDEPGKPPKTPEQLKAAMEEYIEDKARLLALWSGDVQEKLPSFKKKRKVRR